MNKKKKTVWMKLYNAALIPAIILIGAIGFCFGAIEAMFRSPRR
jgi:hypothetical protein